MDDDETIAETMNRELVLDPGLQLDKPELAGEARDEIDEGVEKLQPLPPGAIDETPSVDEDLREEAD